MYQDTDFIIYRHKYEMFCKSLNILYSLKI